MKSFFSLALKNKSYTYLAILIASFLLYGLLSTILNLPSINYIIGAILDFYLSIAENIVNILLDYLKSEVNIKNGVIIFPSEFWYYNENKEVIDNWESYLLFKKWLFFLLLVFWGSKAPIKKKVGYSSILVIIHFISVLSGLIIITHLAPTTVDIESFSQLEPNALGALLMITLLGIWINNHWKDYPRLTISKYNLNLNLNLEKLREIIILLFVFSIIKNFFVPYFNYYSYIHVLLTATKFTTSVLGYKGVIDGPFLIGDYGTLFMAKWCLGFLSMFVFSALVFFFRVNLKATYIYIILGVFLLHITNILRLSFLFIYVQNSSNQQAIENHHSVYNIIVYCFIFILWVIYFEKFRFRKKNSRTPV